MYATLPSTEPEPEKAKEPTEAEKLAAKEAEIARLNQELSSQRAATDARLQGLETALGQRFAEQRRGPAAPPAPEPSSAYAAQQELGLTDEQILSNPLESVKAIAQHIAEKQRAAFVAEVAPVLGGLVHSNYEAQVDSLKSHPYFIDLQDALRGHFEENPSDKMSPGNIRKVFNELVGANIVELQRRAAVREGERLAAAATPAPRARAIEPSIRTPALSISPTKAEDKEGFIMGDGLDGARQELMQEFNKYGVNLSDKEWQAIESGKRFPKKISSDIQVLGRRANVSYD